MHAVVDQAVPNTARRAHAAAVPRYVLVVGRSYVPVQILTPVVIPDPAAAPM